MSTARKFFVLVLAILLASLAACAPAAPITANNESGNQTTIVINGDNTGEITVEQGIVSNTDNSESAVTQTEVPAAEATEASAKETRTDVCGYFAWHNGWENGGPERIHTNGIISRTALESGISMQASWEKWTSTTQVDGYTIPEGFEPNNDGVQAIICGDDVFMLDRTGSTELPFWSASYFQLTDSGLLVCKDDTGEPGSWNGECSDTQVVIKGTALENITVSDFQKDWNELIKLMDSWDGKTPDYGTIEGAWTSKK